MTILFNPCDRANQLAISNGKWVVAVVETQIFWPKHKQVIRYNQREFLLLPLGEAQPPLEIRQLPAICLQADTYLITNEQARHEISQFASALAWQEGGKIDITSWTGGNLPRSMGIFRNNMITEYLETEHLQIPNNEKAQAALAFFREGISLDNPFYAFLSFYKAFSVAVPKTERGTWITNNLNSIIYPRAKDRLEELKKAVPGVSRILCKRRFS